MNLSDVRALIIDDSILKAMGIARALDFSGIRESVRVRDQEAGLEALYKGMEEGKPFHLLVTDMHYPLTAGAEPDSAAGFKLLDRLEKECISIPVIICSSRKFEEPRAIGSVQYHEERDVNWDFRELLNNWKKMEE